MKKTANQRHSAWSPVDGIVGQRVPFERGVLVLALLVTAALFCWQVASNVNLISPLYSNPTGVAKNIARLAESGLLDEHFLASLRRVLVGVLIGTMLGFPLGSALVLFPYARFCALILLPFSAALSKISVFYIFVVLFGIDEAPKYAILIWVTFQYQVLFAFQGAYGLFYGRDRYTQDMMADIAILGPSRFQFYRRILIPLLYDRMYLGMLFASSSSWTMLVVTEGVNRRYGLGAIVDEANQIPIISGIISGTVALALCNLLTWGVIWTIQRWHLRWDR